MAWDKTKPENDMLLINFPAACRANWDAIELLTDSALKITNAKVHDAAGIVDTKLATISTAGKVLGSALNTLSGIPSGAGAIPIANIPTIPGSKLGTLNTIDSGAGIIPDANLPTTLVRTSGDQTIAGVKTFSSIPVLPAADPTSDNQAVRKAYVDNKPGVPTGSILMWGTTSAPTGYLECDGSAVSRTTYADLFSVIGTTFGSGDGSTTFNLPNMKSRVPVGRGQGTSLTNRVLAATGGEETHVLTTTEMPAHTHSIDGFTAGSSTQHPFFGASTNASSKQSGSAGSGAAHNVMNPFLTLTFIIKT